jgi:hypothetical protein
MRKQSILLAATIVMGLAGVCEADLYEWSVSSGGNGHFYEAVLVLAGIDWEHANTAAIARGGYLATITSAEENALVYSLVGSNPDFWRPTGPVNGEGPFLGGYKEPAIPDPAANWHWVTGEPWVYTNWVEIEPSGDETQNRLHFFGYYSRTGPQWNDLPHINYLENGYIVEFAQRPAVVPAPGAALLGALGLSYAGWRLRRRQASANVAD